MFSPREAEATGVRQVLSWLKNHNYDNVIVEMDAKQVLDNIKGPSGSSAFNTIIDDCKLLLNHFAAIQLRFVFNESFLSNSQKSYFFIFLVYINGPHNSTSSFINGSLGQR